MGEHEDRVAAETGLGAFGLDIGINHRTTDVVAEVLAVTEGRGVDLVVDPVSGSTLELSIAAAAYRGRISWVGNASEIATGEAGRPDIWTFMAKNGTMHLLFFAAEMSRRTERVRTIVASLVSRVASGELRVALDRTFLLSEAAEAHRFAERESQFGRIILVPDSVVPARTVNT